MLYLLFIEMFRVWHPQPAVGECDLRYLDLPGVLGEAPWPGGTPLLCQVIQTNYFSFN